MNLFDKVIVGSVMVGLCFSGYLMTSVLADLTGTNGAITISPDIQFRQTTEVSYWFDENTTVNRIDLTQTYLKINGTTTFSIAAGSGELNITLNDVDLSDNRISLSTDQQLANTTITCSVSGLPSPGAYSVYLDDVKVASDFTTEGFISYSFQSTSETHDIEIVISSMSQTIFTLINMTFIFLVLGVVIITMKLGTDQLHGHKLDVKKLMVYIFVLILVLSMIAAMYQIVEGW